MNARTLGSNATKKEYHDLLIMIVGPFGIRCIMKNNVEFAQHGTSSHTLFLSNWNNYYCMTLIHNSSINTSLTFLGSILEMKHKLTMLSLDIVTTPSFIFPIMFSRG